MSIQAEEYVFLASNRPSIERRSSALVCRQSLILLNFGPIVFVLQPLVREGVDR